MNWLLKASVAAGAAAATCLGLSSATSAASVTRYEAQSGQVRLEITALRDDIIRVRAGRGALGEDASWAVSSAARHDLSPMETTEMGEEVVLRTHALTIHLDRANLHLRVEDQAGRVVLDDAAGAALSFNPQDVPGAQGFALRKAMPPDAHYFGLGDKTGPLDRRGGSFVLWNTDAYQFGEATDPLYKSIPFVLGVQPSGLSFGLLADDTWRLSVDFGKAERDTLRIGADGGAVDYYVMAGADPKAVVKAYAYLTGAPPLAPLWSLGFQQSRYSYMNEAQARQVADRLRADHIPADVLYLDIDYQDANRPFTVSSRAYPDLARFIADLKAMDMKVVLITDLHIAKAPGQNYAPYETGMANDVFLKRPDGSTYSGVVWPGQAVFPDYSRASVRDWWGGLYANFVQMGAAGFWNDMNEPSIFLVPGKTMPLDTVHRIDEPGYVARAASHAEMHNVYGMLNSRATYEGLLKLAPDQRPFVLTRATYAGGQRYAATWTGDNTSSWNHLRLSISMLNNLGLSGFSYSGDDIGGYAGAGPSAELLTRWLEVGAFNPIFRDHEEKGKPAQEPWVYGPDYEAIARRYIEARYRLMPYIYALADENSSTGLPIMRPVFLEYPAVLSKGGGPDASSDQFMLGPDLLIAPPPVWESPNPYLARLPGPGWYDYWTGLAISGSAQLETPKLERLAVYVRPGAILPKAPLVQSTQQTPQGALELEVYPGADCKGRLYLDDGVSFAYRKGEYLRQSLSCNATTPTLSLSFGAREGRFKPWWRRIEVVVHGVKAAPARVSLAGQALSSQYDAPSQTLRLSMPDQSLAADLVIQTAPQEGSRQAMGGVSVSGVSIRTVLRQMSALRSRGVAVSKETIP